MQEPAVPVMAHYYFLVYYSTNLSSSYYTFPGHRPDIALSSNLQASAPNRLAVFVILWQIEF